jgi:hypothetical protein
MMPMRRYEMPFSKKFENSSNPQHGPSHDAGRTNVQNDVPS